MPGMTPPYIGILFNNKQKQTIGTCKAGVNLKIIRLSKEVWDRRQKVWFRRRQNYRDRDQSFGNRVRSLTPEKYGGNFLFECRGRCMTVYFFWFRLGWVHGGEGALRWDAQVPLIAARGLSCPVPCGILVPRPGIEPMSCAPEDRFLTVGPPGKSLQISYEKKNCRKVYLGQGKKKSLCF